MGSLKRVNIPVRSDRITKKLSELDVGARVTWKTRTYIILGTSSQEEGELEQPGVNAALGDHILLYAPSGKIARWPADQLIALKDEEFIVYHPRVWDDPV